LAHGGKVGWHFGKQELSLEGSIMTVVRNLSYIDSHVAACYNYMHTEKKLQQIQSD